LNDTQVTDAGLKHLKGLRRLQHLGLVRTQITNNGVAELKRALPNIEISSDVLFAQEDDKTAAHFLARATTSYQGGEHDKAIGDYTEAIRLAPNYAHAYCCRGLAWYMKGEHDKAIADYTKAIRLAPNYAHAYSGRGLACYMKGEHDKAVGDYTEAIRLDPGLASAYNGLAWLLATCPDSKYRDGKKAVQYAMKACELSKWKNHGFLDTLAAAYAETGDFAEAVKWQEKAIELAPEDEKENCRSRLDLYKSGEFYRDDP
jgi:tetratricopeptide (TPR) repeat protein